MSISAVNFGVANNYNVFVFNNINLNNASTGGRMAVGGDISMINYGVSSEIFPLPPYGTDNTLVINGNVNITSGTNFAGNTVVNTTSTITNNTMTNPNGSKITGSPVDFSSIIGFLKCASLYWASLTPNGTVSVSYGQLILTGTDSILNVFEFSSSNVAGSGLALNQLNAISIISPANSTILINVTGTAIAFGSYQIYRNGNIATSNDAKNILWNFPSATSWTNGNTTIYGSTLAPLADATTGYSASYGNFMVKSLVGNLTNHNALFTGSLPDANGCIYQLNATIKNTSNVPIILGNNTSFDIVISNNSPTERLYNLSMYISLPDGLTITAATITQTSSVTNSDGSSLYSWINLKDLAPNEVGYTINITVKSGTTFKTGSAIPIGYIFSGVNVLCQTDTMPRGNYDVGNQKISKNIPMTFKATRYSCKVTAPGKCLKGAGTSLSTTDYAKVYTANCNVINNASSTSTVNLSILIDDGIRYIGNITVTGTDSSKFINSTLSVVMIDNKLYTQIYYGGIALSQNSNTTVNFSYAVWSNYNSNTGSLIPHGTKLNIAANLTSVDDAASNSSSFSAMDIIITTSNNKGTTDVQDTIQYTFNYQVCQYYDIKDINVNYYLPDGIYYLSSTKAPVSVTDDPVLKGFKIVYYFANASKLSQYTVIITAKVDSYYRYKVNPDMSPLPVVSGDNFIATTDLSGTNVQLLVTVTDNATTLSTIKLATITKQFLQGFYRNGTAKTITPLAPGDLAQYKLTYDATALKAIQKQIYIDDFFPLSADPIDNLTYTYTGYTPSGLAPQLIEPHGVDFYYGNIPGTSLSTITFKVPIELLGSSAQNQNLMKLKGINTDGLAYSSRAQVLINIGIPNLTLTKTVTGPNKSAIKSGEIYVYTVKISNSSNLGTETDAFSFTLTDALSTWFTVDPTTIKVTGTGSYQAPTMDSSLIILNINKLAPGQSLTLIYSVKISDYMPPVVSIALAATTTSPYSQLYDVALSNYQYSNLNKTASVTIASATITVTKASSLGTFKVLSEIAYTIIVTIPQGTIAYDLYLKDTLPSGMQTYLGSATRNTVPVTPTVASNVVTFPNEGAVDARTTAQVITYAMNCKISNGTKSVGATTSTQTNSAQVLYRREVAGTQYSVTKTLVVTINHPNLVMSLNGIDKTTSTVYSSTANINVSAIMDFKLTFTNNSAMTLINGVIEIPVSTNFNFSTINSTLLCSAVYNSTTKKLMITIPSLGPNNSGYVDFTLVPVSTLRAGTTITLQARATQYYNDLGKSYTGGEVSNTFTCSLPPGVSLLPNLLDKRDDATSFRASPPGSTTTIINYFQNTGGGTDDFTIIISPVAIAYTLTIDSTVIGTISPNTSYQADLNIMKNLVPSQTRTITITAVIPSNSKLGARYDFVVTTKSKTSPYPQKTVLNIDPS